jgi:hypothetical protein
VGVTLLAVLLLGSIGWWLGARDGSTVDDGVTAGEEASTASTEGSTASPSSEPSDSAAVVESQRRVTVDGAIVTIEETSTVVAGARVKATPADAAPLGLRLLSTTIQSPDGRASTFDTPVELRSTGSLTTRGRYRLTDCPDVLPAVWPSPTHFPGATQTYSRLEEPLHTAYAICPNARPRAKPLDGISGELVAGDDIRIKLTFGGGGDTLSVSAIGSASTVAAIAVESSSMCGADPSCVALMTTDGASEQTGTATFTMQPVDPCPPETTSDTLVLLVSGGSFPPEPAAIEVDGLHRVICR